MPSWCAGMAAVLGNLLISFETTPIDLVENTLVEFHLASLESSFRDDAVYAPPSFTASGVELTLVSSSVLAGQTAAFKLAPIASTPRQTYHRCVLITLASVIEASAAVRLFSLDASTVDVQAPVYIEVSAELDCVVLAIEVPPGTPNNSLVLINRVCVAGCEMHLSRLSSCMTVGFNHAPASVGALFLASAAGDEAGIEVALRKGGSTEEMDIVSATGNKT